MRWSLTGEDKYFWDMIKKWPSQPYPFMLSCFKSNATRTIEIDWHVFHKCIERILVANCETEINDQTIPQYEGVLPIQYRSKEYKRKHIGELLGYWMPYLAGVAACIICVCNGSPTIGVILGAIIPLILKKR